MDFLKLKPEVIDDIDAGIAVELQSSPGLGKSEFVKQLVADLSKRDGFEWGFATCFLATMTPPDLMGYMFKGERDFGNGPITVTEPTLPLWMITTQGKPTSHYKRGILFLDEMNGAMPSTASALYQLILDFRIGAYKLPDNWTIIAAGNNAGDRGVTHQMPAPLNNRFCHIDFEIDADDWQIQAMKDKIHAHIRAHLRLKSANLHSFDSKINPRSFPTPRSWYFADQIYKQDVPAAIKHELIVGTIGEPHAVEFFGFVRDIQHMPDIDSVMMNPERAPLPGSPAVMHALVTTLVDDRLTVGNYDRLMKYIARLPQEISVVFNRSAYAKDPRIANSSTYIDWCVANQDVIR